LEERFDHKSLVLDFNAKSRETSFKLFLFGVVENILWIEDARSLEFFPLSCRSLL